MFCTYCNAARPDNAGPCPNCGAPAPMPAGQAQFGSQGPGNASSMAWGGPGPGASFKEQWEQQQVPQLAFENQASNNPWRSPSGQLGAGNPSQQPSGQLGTGNPWQQPSGQLGATNPWQQPAFDQQAPAPMPSWQQPSGQLADQANPMPSWQQTGSQRPATGQLQWATDQNGNQSATQDPLQQSGQHMLPVPYAGGMALEPVGRQPTISLQLVPEQAISHLLPAEPLSQPETVHVAPMYTKPRPIIPKKRAVNGLISVLIVTLLLCVGSGYLAKTTGLWANALAFYNGKPVTDIQTSSVKIPDPGPPVEGPAAKNIPSAALASRVDNNTNEPVIPSTVFRPGQYIYVTYSVQADPGKTGTAIVTWYTDGHFYTNVSHTVTGKQDYKFNAVTNEQFPNPTSGKVEITWNGKLAQTLYFAVR
ncbi:hypothetical protein ccbrp13_52410 [Ktedonobacteria bacterium brp13]|nr:hypothetical protein ccbrp13_52410 [Ktedonobacteria bacterium brp13]